MQKQTTLSHATAELEVQQVRAPSAVVTWFLQAISQTERFAHHPVCGCYDRHLVRIGRRSVCLGCTFLILGIVTGLAILTLQLVGLFGGRGRDVYTELSIGLCLFAPTLLQPFIQVKPVKVASRFSLGVSIVWLWQAAMLTLPLSVLGWVLRVVFGFVFLVVYLLTQRFRVRFTPSPCDSCQHGRYPFCEGNRSRVALLLPELRLRSGPEDQAFVAFVESHVGTASTHAS